MAPPPRANPMAFTVGRSRRLLLALVVLHLGAGACAFSLPVPPWSLPLPLVAVAASLVVSARRHATRTAPDAVVGANLHRDGGWVLTFANGAVADARCLPRPYVHPALVVVRFRVPDRWRRPTLVVAGDAIGADDFRRLRRTLVVGASR